MSHAWIQKFCPRGKGERGTVCFSRGDGVFFVNFTVNVSEEGGGGADRHPNSPISAHLNVIALFMIVSREITERQDCLSTEARVTR